VELKQRAIETGTAVRERISFPGNGGETIYDIAVEPLRNDQGVVIGATTVAFDAADRSTGDMSVKTP
jgi:hypothetical protein